MRLYNRVNAQSPTSHASTAASASTDNDSNPFFSGSDNEHVFLVYLYVGHVNPLIVFLLTRMLCQLHIRYAGVCAGAHVADSCDEQDLCGRAD
jgi:hypothetical protein